jgi:hypothetical protein
MRRLPQLFPNLRPATGTELVSQIKKSQMKSEPCRAMLMVKKRDRSKVTFVLNTNDINRALSQVLIDFKEFKTDQQQNSSEGKKQRFKSNKN